MRMTHLTVWYVMADISTSLLVKKIYMKQLLMYYFSRETNFNKWCLDAKMPNKHLIKVCIERFLPAKLETICQFFNKNNKNQI